MAEKIEKIEPFKILYDIPGKKRLYSKEQVLESGLSSYLLIQYLSSNNIGIHIAGYLCKNYNLKIYDMYLFAFISLPAQINYIKWVKKDKLKADKNIDLLQDWYGCGRETAELYLSSMTKEELKKIKSMCDIGGFKK